MSDESHPDDEQISKEAEAEAELPSVVELLGQNHLIELPRSPAIRHEVTYAIGESKSRASAAALGLCVGKLRRKLRNYRYDPLEYGGEVIEHLLEQGAKYTDIMRAGQLCWVHMSRGCLPAAEVKETEGFSEAQADDSTG